MASSPKEVLDQIKKKRAVDEYEVESRIEEQLMQSDFNGKNSVMVNTKGLSKQALTDVLERYKKRGWFVKPVSELKLMIEFVPTVEV